MAKVITNELQHSGASGANITLDSSKNVTIGNNLSVTGTIPADKLTGTAAAINGSNITNLPAANLTGTLPAISGANLTGIPTRTTPFRNLIDNGAMQVSQRGTSAVSFAHDGTTSGFSLDRWKTNTYNLDEYDWTMQQVSDGPAGFAKSMKWTTGTAESAVATDEYAGVQQALEGQDYQSLCYGTSDAKSTILSFWVKSSITGTYAVSIWRNESTQRAINGTYTISAANTWEKKTITFAGDTSGPAITSDNIERFRIFFAVGAGATYNATATSSWANYVNGHWAGGQATNGVLTTAGATWYLTGVQLELGDTATDFEHISYQDELARCQRYYFRAIDTDGTTDLSPGVYACIYQNGYKIAQVELPVPMRATPTMTAVWVNGTYNVAKSSNTRMVGYFSSANDSSSPIHSTSIKCEAEL